MHPRAAWCLNTSMSIFHIITAVPYDIYVLQVFMSTEEIDLTERDLKTHNDKTTTLTNTDGTPSTVAAEPQQSVEFDSPDSGLPSSRNYSVTSGILSSTDDGQSICFEEEESSTESDKTEMSMSMSTPRKTKGVLKMQDSICEEQLCSQLEYLSNSEDISSMCPTSYTVSKIKKFSLIFFSVFK